MDGQSRGKLVKAGYKIFRMRDVHPIEGGHGPVVLEIREMSDRGQWVKYGTYPTKAARERAWKELHLGDMHLMDYALEPASVEDVDVCEWILPGAGKERDEWETSCGQSLNDMKYCCYCGKKLIEKISYEDLQS